MTDSTAGAIPGVESFLFTSPKLDVKLRISLARPVFPIGQPAPEAKRPVVYVTDADYSFGMCTEVARMGGNAGEVEPAIVVGIGYADETGDYNFVGLRRGFDFYRGPPRDLELPGLGKLRLGGGDSFLAAIADELIPEIERRRPDADPARRFLIWTSAGGHFAAYALSQRPEVFAGYAMMSPALVDFPPGSTDTDLVAAVATMPSGSIPRGTRVFLSSGSLEEEPGEPIAAAAILTNALRLRRALAVHGVDTELRVFPGETHISVPAVALTHALRYLLPGPKRNDWQGALKAKDR